MSNLNSKKGGAAEGAQPESATIEVVRRFVDCINDKRVDRLLSLMTKDHLFVDSMGGEVRGRSALREPWHRYLALFPDYKIEARSYLQTGETIAILGRSSGTLAVSGVLHADNRWTVPTAWRAVVEGNKVASWQVYADNEPVRAIMKRAGLF